METKVDLLVLLFILVGRNVESTFRYSYSTGTVECLHMTMSSSHASTHGDYMYIPYQYVMYYFLVSLNYEIDISLRPYLNAM